MVAIGLPFQVNRRYGLKYESVPIGLVGQIVGQKALYGNITGVFPSHAYSHGFSRNPSLSVSKVFLGVPNPPRTAQNSLYDRIACFSWVHLVSLLPKCLLGKKLGKWNEGVGQRIHPIFQFSQSISRIIQENGLMQASVPERTSSISTYMCQFKKWCVSGAPVSLNTAPRLPSD